MLEYQVHVTLGGVTMVLGFLPRPLDGERSELFEGAKQCLFCYVPGYAAEKHFRGVDRVSVATRGEHTGPSADDGVVAVVFAVVLAGAVRESGLLVRDGGEDGLGCGYVQFPDLLEAGVDRAGEDGAGRASGGVRDDRLAPGSIEGGDEGSRATGTGAS